MPPMSNFYARICVKATPSSNNFVFYGTKTQQNRQVGNAVPPLLGKAIASQISALISDEK